MMRFISEKQVNLSANNISKKKYSTSKQINQSKIIPDIPKQEINNSSTALRSLKKINDYKQMIKGRVSVLQIHQQKNDFRAFLNEQKYQFHQHMKQQMNKERQEKDLYHKHLLKKLDQARINAKTHRRMHESNLKKAKEEIYNSNKYDYMEKKQKSISIQKNINKFIQQTKEINKSRYLMVKQDQKTIINNIKKFQNEKKLEIKSRDWQQIEKVNRVKEERKRQIQQLAQLQLYMLQKQARSKMTSQESERKLMLLLKGGNKNVSTSHTTKLPAINPEEKKQHTDPDIFVI